ncbi:RiPP maturation radical SAM C-methyltransferase [Polymorphum gilvum]|uniref:Radical SAM domain protein n=1 Tax=Polymorphum gilvum (strain LMG 25793 / CGMCC 1.9160 / SL003B-26A1) TaxID=991905 RepID=F2IY40_POLGS|nr:RiPP maturation radical SAM C-methyltransferase [Polymorphum gilvum]ADZ70543.1 Radical SAM domain protein [Polymorphum gilvum SL003B-26A1]
MGTRRNGTAPAEASGRRGSPRVLLVHMPMADPILPNLGIEILSECLRATGIACDVFYGTLRLPPVVSPGLTHGLLGQALYTPLYHDLDIDAFVEGVAAVALETSRRDGRERVTAELHKGVMAAEMNLERCLAEIPAGAYDVVGFSIIFDTQKLPSAALARLLKRREPGLKVLFGGTGCDGDMAAALLEAFPEVDAVMTGDADRTIAAGVRHLAGEPVPAPANLLTRAAQHTTPAQIHIDAAELEARARPRYDGYIAQRAASPYAHTHDLTLLFEGSRGCWWGDKRHCKFCGIRTVQEGFRQRSPQAVLDEIVALYDAHRPYLLYATDAILSREHMFALLPELARLRRETGRAIKLFFEVKSNLTRADVALLADAGVVAVQPGIESFSDAMLRRTDKGASGIRQLAALKWLCAYGIDTIYGLLVGTPGETPDDLRALIALCGRIRHLQPPVSVNALGLHRFSPYFDAPEAHGITNVRPFRLSEAAYRVPAPLLMRLSYELDYDLPARTDPEHIALTEELRTAVTEWTVAHAGGERLTVSEGPRASIVMRRRDTRLAVETLEGADARLYRAIAAPVGTARAAELAGLTVDETARRLARFDDLDLAVELDGAWLALAVPVNVDAERDAAPRTVARRNLAETTA